MKTIIVNGKEKYVAVKSLSFDDVVCLAVGEFAYPSEFTITYRGKSFDDGYVGGNMSRGDRIIPAEGNGLQLCENE